MSQHIYNPSGEARCFYLIAKWRIFLEELFGGRKSMIVAFRATAAANDRYGYT